MALLNRLFLLIGALLATTATMAQNLVPNPGFESYSSLPGNYGQYYLAIGWSNVNNNTTGPPYGSPDYFHTSGGLGTYFGQIAPHGGSAQMGFYTYLQALGDAREYLAAQLTTPLVPGQQYKLTFYLTNGLGGAYTASVDNFGIHFSVGALTQITDEVINVIPQLEIPGQIYHSNFWQEYTFTFTATNAATHITFGNFENDSNTQVSGGNSSYYFIDDIELISLTPTLQIQGNTTICAGAAATLSATNGTTYSWATNHAPGTIFSTDSVVTVSPAITTTYFVYGATDTVSHTVAVGNPPAVNLGSDATLCPGQTLPLTAPAGATYMWQNNSTAPNFTVTQPGTYWVAATNSCGTTTDSITVSFTALPAVYLGADTALCTGQNLLLDAATANGTLVWHNNSTDSSFTVTQPGTYWVSVTNQCGTATDSITVAFTAPPAVYLGADTTLCTGQNLLLDAATANAAYLWHNNSTDSSFTVTLPGTYWVAVTGQCGTTTDSVTVAYASAPVANLGSDTTLCPGQSLPLSAASANATYLWHNGSTSAGFTATQAGTYWVTVANTCGFTTDSITVAYDALPSFSLGADTALCPGQNLPLNATTANATYAWHDNSTGSGFTVSEQGTYWVSVTNNCGTTTDTINVSINTIPAFVLGEDRALCAGETQVIGASVPNATYLWHNNSTDSLFTVIEPGTFWVAVTNQCATSTDSVTVAYNALPVVSLGPDQTLCSGATTTLNATTPNATYKWHNNSTSPTFSAELQGNYWVAVTVNNCTTTDSVTVKLIECEAILVMPNVFTPNNDGLNDYFSPIKMEGIIQATLTVYNRWGQRLFETAHVAQGWNGLTDGDACPSAIYFWTVTYNGRNGEDKTLRGSMTLIR